MRLEAFGNKYPFLKDNLSFWESYIKARDVLFGMLDKMIDPEKLKESGFLSRLDEGKPFLTFERISLSGDDINSLAAAFCKAFGLKEHKISMPDPIPLYENLPVTEDEAGFVLAEVHSSIASYIESIIGGDEEAINWLEPNCPICGASAGMGLITPSGKKNLVCSHCYSVWVYLRTACGLCGHAEERGATFFSAEELPYWIIETCESCGHYLKVCDMREELPDIIIYPLHYLTTWELDLAAREKGLEPGLFGVFARAAWIKPRTSN